MSRQLIQANRTSRLKPGELRLQGDQWYVGTEINDFKRDRTVYLWETVYNDRGDFVRLKEVPVGLVSMVTGETILRPQHYEKVLEWDDPEAWSEHEIPDPYKVGDPLELRDPTDYNEFTDPETDSVTLDLP